MPSDQRAVMAREAHRRALASDQNAAREREKRDRLIRDLRQDDAGTWTYDALSKAVGVSKEMVAVIIKGDPRKR